MNKNLLIIPLILGVFISAMVESNETNKGSADLRKMVFALNPNDIGITKENFGHPVWGMVMETGFPEGSFTLVALADGTTSLYFSNGGGIIGSGEHDSVRKASGYFLSGAQHFYKKGQKVTKYPTPADGNVNFYFLTFNGTLLYSAPEAKLGNNKDALSDLFYAAHGVITELRKIQDK